MNSRLKQHAFIFLAYVMAIVLSLIAGNTLLWQICSWITGSEAAGALAAGTLMQILLFVIAFIIIFFYKKNGSEQKIVYVTKLKEEPYDAKNDFRKLMRSVDFWGEIIFVSVITIVFRLFNPAFNLIMLNIPLYFVFSLAANLYLHNLWAKNTHNH